MKKISNYKKIRAVKQANREEQALKICYRHTALHKNKESPLVDAKARE